MRCLQVYSQRKIFERVLTLSNKTVSKPKFTLINRFHVHATRHAYRITNKSISRLVKTTYLKVEEVCSSETLVFILKSLLRHHRKLLRLYNLNPHGTFYSFEIKFSQAKVLDISPTFRKPSLLPSSGEVY